MQLFLKDDMKKIALIGLAVILIMVGATYFGFGGLSFQFSLMNPGDNLGVAIPSLSQNDMNKAYIGVPLQDVGENINLNIAPNRINIEREHSVKIATAINRKNIILSDCNQWYLHSADITVTTESDPGYSRTIKYTYPQTTPHTLPIPGETIRTPTVELKCTGNQPFLWLGGNALIGFDNHGQASGIASINKEIVTPPEPDPPEPDPPEPDPPEPDPPGPIPPGPDPIIPNPDPTQIPMELIILLIVLIMIAVGMGYVALR